MNISPFKIAIPKAELEDLQEKSKVLAGQMKLKTLAGSGVCRLHMLRN